MSKRERYTVYAKQTQRVEYIVEATSYKNAENKVYDGHEDADPIDFYDQEIEVIQVVKTDEIQKT
jgi:hypothetical protein